MNIKLDTDSFNIIGESPEIRAVFDIVGRAAASQSTVMIYGESGTGKELIARALHLNSPRKSKPFIAVNCAAIPHDLLESELFGYEKGAFTGAVNARIGRIELANQGTIFFDEIGDMPPALQVKLLRVLAEREIDRIGSVKSTPVDIRVITATHQNLEVAIEEGRFREDLYYRLNVIPLTLIPLRERKDDISLLAEHFMNQFCQENSRSSVKMDPATLTLLKKYRWPGNIRELGNIIERTCLMCQGDTLLPSHLFFDDEPLSSGKNGANASFTGTIYEMEKELILQTLEEFSGNKTKAAESLGISIRTLRNKLNEYNESE